MSTLFKNTWKQLRKDHPLLDVEMLDFQVNDLTIRMAESPSYQEWNNLYHERERVQALRDAIARSL